MEAQLVQIYWCQYRAQWRFNLIPLADITTKVDMGELTTGEHDVGLYESLAASLSIKGDLSGWYACWRNRMDAFGTLMGTVAGAFCRSASR